MTNANNAEDNRILELVLDAEELLPQLGATEDEGRPGKIPLVDESMSYSNFFERYLVKNRPCLLTDALTSNWESRKNWVTRGDTDRAPPPINYQHLCAIYGDEKVCVTDCHKSAGDEPEILEMTMKEYLGYLKEAHTGENSTRPCLYLKDWHIARCTSTDAKIGFPYDVPVYFKSDWLNEYCSALDIDDFRFCYIGPKGSWTGFHSDVYSSFSWSANVVGRKKWRIYLPDRIGQFAVKKDDGNVKSDLRGTVQYKYDYENPGEEGLDYFDVIQEAGQVIFIPSGWFHVVWNLEDTISINHNWFNGSNLHFVWETLCAALNDVAMELSDLKDDEEFPTLCQSLLKANHGMNYEEFLDILLFIWKKRSAHQSSQSHCGGSSSGEAEPGPTTITATKPHFSSNVAFSPNHIQYDLKSIEKVVSIIEADVRNREISNGVDLLIVNQKLAQFDI